jgi:hypothetical protein
MTYNSYVISLIEYIDFTYNPCFTNNYEIIEKANKNLKLFLSLITEAVDQQITHIKETEQPIEDYLVDKRNELIGPDALGEYSDIVLFEAHYYMRLFKLSDKHFERLGSILDLYENPETRNDAIQKLNSLILINICYYCAGQGPDKPLFALSDNPVSKEQQDLEVSIIYLLRHMNEANLIVSHTLVNPMDIILSSVETKKPVINIPETIQIIEKDNNNSLIDTFNKSEWIILISATMVFISIVVFYVNRYLINKLR